MALRKASSYSKKYARPYTRNSRRKDKSYIKTVPVVKIARFHFGTPADYRAGKHKFIVRMVADENAQIRDTAIESGRMMLNKALDEGVIGQYYLAVKVFPHHFLRDNKTAAGAGADRLSTGMSHSFGIVAGRAAIVRKGTDLFFVSGSSEKVVKVSRETMNSIRSKLPCKTKIVFEKRL